VSSDQTTRRRKRPGQVRRAWGRFRRDRFAMTGLVFLVIVGLMAIFRDVITRYGPQEQLTGPPFSGPSRDHLLGTDDLGRDIFSRILEGASVSIRFSVIVVLGALVVAVPLGMLSGYVGGKLDMVVMRIMDGVMALPGLVLAIAIVSVLGADLNSSMIALGIAMIPGFTRLVRGQALAVREETFVEASQSIGTPTGKVLWMHLFPNIGSPLIVQASIVLGLVLLAEAGLSFLGLGAQPPTASWGVMLQSASQFVLVHPWQVIPPGLAIALSVLAFNTIGDGLRAALGTADPIRRHGRLGLTSVASRRDGGEITQAASDETRQPLLSVEHLTVEFQTEGGRIRVVDDVSFDVAPGETLGLVGESGSGKTVTSMSIMRLLPSPPAEITSGAARLGGDDLLTMDFDDIARRRGAQISMIFQDPMASLNPALTILHQVAQAVRWHEKVGRREAERRALEALDHVGIPTRRARSYPHEFSGGMRQRAMIAMALVGRPELLIADEPTTALDVTVQAQVLELLKELRSELGMAMIFVTHDLGVVADICDRVAVMYAGEIVELAPVDDFFRQPRHPYSEGLLRSMPQQAAPRSTLYSIPGQVPHFTELGDGCRLLSRCPHATDRCAEARIPIVEVGDGRAARCIRVDELEPTPR
jgi:peptide/nickel transport system permease protein